jgi:hypothetical protein
VYFSCCVCYAPQRRCRGVDVLRWCSELHHCSRHCHRRVAVALVSSSSCSVIMSVSVGCAACD